MKKSIENIVKHAEVSEKATEQYLTACVKQMGGMCLKYSNPGMVGFPDRVCLLPGGITLWVELKSKGQQLRTMQRIRISQMLHIGHLVNVCKSKEDIDKMLEPYKSGSHENKM